MDAWLVTLILGQLVFIGFIIAVFASSQAKKARLRSEERLRILERFNSAAELNELLKSDNGRDLLQVFASSAASRTNPQYVILAAIALGVLTIFGGLAFGALILFFGRQNELADVSPMAAVLLLTSGVGVVVAAGISLFLARAWNLVAKPGHGD